MVQPIKPRYLTVVFEVDDPALFAGFSAPLFASLRGEPAVPGARVTAASLEDEIARVEQLEASVDTQGALDG
ncbi:hypothetical protein [Chitinimonas koreensis]|uniref:hypothetical protein n=1 Tax=Chitinimonas koreensis TaxID=356302 RepID=UPI00040AFB52|nr:hypothetical protein [Chitinimonas koreensis]QNM95447.1 hypothetical protein H9L41_16460 [Chitinimonas koreensis]